MREFIRPKEMQLIQQGQVIDKIREYIVEILCGFIGITLFSLGLIGISGYPAEPIRELTKLIEPTSFGATIDRIYLTLLMISGIAMTLVIKVRLVAAFTLTLILAKLAIVNELFSVF